MISIIIPALNEQYLLRTLDNILYNSCGDIEIIVVLDGPTQHLTSFRSDITIINNPETRGVRPSINQAVSISHGDYILKTDAHCSFGYGFDETLQNDCDDNWISVARRYTLDPETWTKHPRVVDYYYLSCPWTHPRSFMMQSCPWITRTEERTNIQIDDLMCFQGSMWFMSRKHWDHLGGLEIGKEIYAEHHELSMKTWLGGGRVIINKNTWYAHPKESVRGYHMSMRQVFKDHDHSARYWLGNVWRDRVHDFEWLIDKFWPLPTEHNRHKIEKYYWPEDWKDYYDRVMRNRLQI